MVSSDNGSPPPESKTGGADNRPVEVILASWTDRFVAWLIDFIIVSVGLGILFALLALPFWFSDNGNGMAIVHRDFGSFHYLLSSAVFFAYWTYFEHTSGQSIGKRLLKIKSTDMSGKGGVDIKSALLESFGKSFLLPIDVILGWLFTNNKRQRIFNKISNTIVIKLKPREELPENIKYRKD
ncbi:MAG TPA: RDD family protein [Nitrososphaeraceae archaeon]|nr:RDD family protein [Nitrososphaeraceae archaeon]